MRNPFEYKCTVCGKLIMDVSEGRFEYNKKQHIEKHKREAEKQKGGVDD